MCPYHRFSLGVKWKPSKQCEHPHHEESGQKSAKTFTVTLATISKLNSENPFLFKIGSKMCRNHLMKVTTEQKKGTENLNDSLDLSQSIDPPADEPFEPHVVVLDDVADENLEFVQNLCSEFSMTPVKHRFGVKETLRGSEHDPVSILETKEGGVCFCSHKFL